MSDSKTHDHDDAQRRELAGSEVSTSACLHANRAGRQLGEIRDTLRALQLPLHAASTLRIHAMHLKDILCNAETNPVSAPARPRISVLTRCPTCLAVCAMRPSDFVGDGIFGKRVHCINTSMICVCAALIMFAVGAQAGDGAQEVVQVMHAYEDAWSRHDAHAIAGFYCEPAMRVTKDGPAVRETRAVQQGFFSGFLSQLVVKGYDDSACDRLDVRLLDANAAIASGAVTRYRGDGTVFEHQGVTYGLWRTEQGWKIFFSATHEPTRALDFHSPMS